MIRLTSLALGMLVLSGCGQSNTPATETTAGTNAAATAETVTTPIAISGQAVFNRCASCHAVKAGQPNGIGPNLHNIVGAKIANVAGYEYSKGLKAKAGIWDKTQLDGYLTSPVKYAPGTKMMFAGLARPEDRAAVIAYLATLK